MVNCPVCGGNAHIVLHDMPIDVDLPNGKATAIEMAVMMCETCNLMWQPEPIKHKLKLSYQTKIAMKDLAKELERIGKQSKRYGDDWELPY